MPTERSRSNFESTVNANVQDNTTGDITAAEIRDDFKDLAYSSVMFEDLNPITAGGIDTYTASASPTLTSYSKGRFYLVKFTNANTGAATLNINSLGAKDITKNGTTALESGDIVSGQVLLLGYDGTRFQIISFNSQATSSVNDTDKLYFNQEDFLLGTATRSQWSSSSSGAGAAFGINSPGYGINTTENVIGVASITTGTTTTGRTHIFLANLIKATHKIRFRLRVSLQNLSDATDTYAIRFGLSDLSNIASGDPDNGIFFSYTHSVNSGEYEAKSINATTATTVDTNIAATTTYKVFEILIAQDWSSAKFYIDGTLVATITTNIPTPEMYFYAHILKSAGTTDRALHLDWTELTISRTTAR